MQSKIIIKERTLEENLEFLKSIKSIYKISKKADEHKINKSNLYNVLNNGIMSVQAKYIDALVTDIIEELLEVTKDYVEVVEEE